jgi:hypothetical protein
VKNLSRKYETYFAAYVGCFARVIHHGSFATVFMSATPARCAGYCSSMGYDYTIIQRTS